MIFPPGRYMTNKGIAEIKGGRQSTIKNAYVIYGELNGGYVWWIQDGSAWEGRYDLLYKITRDTHPEYYL